MKNVHALLVGVAGALIAALAGYLAHFDASAITSNPILVSLIGVAIAAASKGLGVLLGKLGQPR